MNFLFFFFFKISEKLVDYYGIGDNYFGKCFSSLSSCVSQIANESSISEPD